VSDEVGKTKKGNMKARPIPELKALIESKKLELELLKEEADHHSKLYRLKMSQYKDAYNIKEDAEYELRNHPDSLRSAANNAYEFNRDMEAQP
jgi:hypothetical protein